MSSSKAILLKEEGNRYFQAGDYVRAEAVYSKALIADPLNPTLYTNRAMARLRMQLWENVIADCEECLKLSPDSSMKAHYYLSQAHLALRHYDDAVEHARIAYDLCVQTLDKSLASVLAQVLKSKKERWDDLEKRRTRENSDLEAEMLSLMERERDEALRPDGDETMDEGSRREITEEWEKKMTTMCDVFNKARSADDKPRVVPEWAIDDISFGFMHDPVVTKTGKSYERASIMEHLRRQNMDPITRTPLYPSDLRPNLDLKQACDEFLQENGWAADW
ncbi:hypothetical protein B0T25DRAFT_188944 [Lasiosphaeria hispida]|uniref:U-box domain-containing protein n=1 Tax=Lasiosphaeria hispida TaxID=260671 RepID=A0AAJ0MDM0_9PEZI|nr:hypothetical protein B0T25DRAFT_188944 [Lasiosphaeria hispida]